MSNKILTYLIVFIGVAMLHYPYRTLQPWFKGIILMCSEAKQT